MSKSTLHPNTSHPPLSPVYAYIHPFLLLSLPYFSFAALVDNPVETLWTWAPVVAGLQAVLCILGLPVRGTTMEGKKKKKPNNSPSASTGGAGKEFGGRIVQTLLSLLLTLSLATPLFALALLLFGAPATTHHAHTALLALHLALLATPPLFYTHGLDVAAWRRILSLQTMREPLTGVLALAGGACLGAWVGAVPIPLDWDREWQRWPVTVVLGAYGGAAVGLGVGGMVEGLGLGL